MTDTMKSFVGKKIDVALDSGEMSPTTYSISSRTDSASSAS